MWKVSVKGKKERNRIAPASGSDSGEVADVAPAVGLGSRNEGRPAALDGEEVRAGNAGQACVQDPSELGPVGANAEA